MGGSHVHFQYLWGGHKLILRKNGGVISYNTFTMHFSHSRYYILIVIFFGSLRSPYTFQSYLNFSPWTNFLINLSHVTHIGSNLNSNCTKNVHQFIYLTYNDNTRVNQIIWQFPLWGGRKFTNFAEIYSWGGHMLILEKGGGVACLKWKVVGGSHVEKCEGPKILQPPHPIKNDRSLRSVSNNLTTQPIHIFLPQIQ